ncbi:MAG: hypothetical protein HKL84_10265 [Acidimicrobiaceae bacterium]|nr:hypothetical protein [Acidimicrobiaceae bacterium]
MIPAKRAIKKGTVDNLVDLGSVVLSLVVVLIVFSGSVGPLRALLVLAFTLFVPGHAILGMLPNRMRSLPKSSSSRSELVIPILLSLSLITLVASIALWLNIWYPLSIFALEAEFSTVLLAAGFINRRLSKDR